MNRYKEAFSKGKVLVPFSVIGDPDYKTSLEIVKTIINAGADVLELGFAFSDPIADGPTIQAADNRALSKKINTDKNFEFIKQIRKYSDIPIGLLVYSNLVYQRGINKFYKDAKKAGVCSVLVADLPVEEAQEYILAGRRNKVDTVFIVSPLTSNERLKRITEKTRGFVYVVARLGVTGTRVDVGADALKLLKRIRPQTTLPLCVGFGISKPEHVRDVIKAGADGAIVGSAVVKIIEKNLNNKTVMLSNIREYIQRMKKAVRGA